jgi:hypothetical protein
VAVVGSVGPREIRAWRRDRSNQQCQREEFHLACRTVLQPAAGKLSFPRCGNCLIENTASTQGKLLITLAFAAVADLNHRGAANPMRDTLAADFDSAIRRFDPFRLSQLILLV